MAMLLGRLEVVVLRAPLPSDTKEGISRDHLNARCQLCHLSHSPWNFGSLWLRMAASFHSSSMVCATGVMAATTFFVRTLVSPLTDEGTIDGTLDGTVADEAEAGVLSPLSCVVSTHLRKSRRVCVGGEHRTEIWQSPWVFV